MGRGRCQRWLCSHRVSGRSPHHAPDTRPGDRAHALTTPSPVLWRSVLKPLASPRRLIPGRAIVPSALTTPSPVLWRSVLKPLASPRRLTPGLAIVPSALTTPSPVLWRSVLKPLASLRRLTPGRAIVSSGLTTPSSVLWRSVLEPLASPRRLTPGLRSVPRCRPPRCWSRYGALRIAAVSPPAGQGLVTAIHPMQPATSLLAPVNPVRMQGTPALAGGNRWAGTAGNAGVVLIGCPADRLTTSPIPGRAIVPMP